MKTAMAIVVVVAVYAISFIGIGLAISIGFERAGLSELLAAGIGRWTYLAVTDAIPSLLAVYIVCSRARSVTPGRVLWGFIIGLCVFLTLGLLIPAADADKLELSFSVGAPVLGALAGYPLAMRRRLSTRSSAQRREARAADQNDACRCDRDSDLRHHLVRCRRNAGSGVGCGRFRSNR